MTMMPAVGMAAVSEELKEISMFLTQFFGKYEQESRDHLEQLLQTMRTIQTTIDGLRSAHTPTAAELYSSANAIYELYEAVKKSVSSLQQNLKNAYDQQQMAASQLSYGMK